MSKLNIAGIAFGAGVAIAATMSVGTATAAVAPTTFAASAASSPSAGPQEPQAVAKSAASAKGTGPAHQLSKRDAELQARQAPLLEAAGIAITASHVAGSDIAGASIDVAAGKVDLYRTKPTAALPAGMAKGGVTISVHAAKFSAGQLEQAAAKLKASGKSLGDRGIAVSAVSIPVTGAGLDVTLLSAPTNAAGAPKAQAATEAKSTLNAVLGNAVATTKTSTAKWDKSSEYFSGWRFNDFPSWYGGDRIAQGCTTGFPAVYNGAMEMMTATHCGGVGTVFTNGPRTNGSTSYMGTVISANSGTDVSVIDVAGSSNYINVGPAQNSSVRAVGSWQSPVVGSYICQSGSYTGEVCGLRIVDTGQSVCTSYILWWCTAYMGPMADVVNYLGPNYYAAGHGDSGGPLYWYDSAGYVRPVGQVHGQLFPNAKAAYPAYFTDQMWCPAPEGWQQRCSAGFSFAHMPGK
jgi:hypothetical protein